MGTAVIAVRERPESFLPSGIEEVQTIRSTSNRKLLHLSNNQPYRLHSMEVWPHLEVNADSGRRGFRVKLVVAISDQHSRVVSP